MRRSLHLDLISLGPLIVIHEAGHLLMAVLFHVRIVSAFVVSTLRDERLGIGVQIDFSTSPNNYVTLLILLGGFLTTVLLGALIYHYAPNEAFRSIGLIWIVASPCLASYDFLDIGLLCGFTNLNLIRILTYLITGALLIQYAKMIKTYDK